jgi:hypothetical protein
MEVIMKSINCDGNGNAISVECDAFIIPNRQHVFTENEMLPKWKSNPIEARIWKCLVKDSDPANKANIDLVQVSWENFMLSGEYINAESAIIPSEWVQLWFTDPEDEDGDSNLVDHGTFRKFENLKRFSSFLPAFLFNGKVEGDTVEFDYCDSQYKLSTNVVHFKLHLNQKSYRYARFGKFEDAFSHVTK